MDRNEPPPRHSAGCIPHTRGDGPAGARTGREATGYSPHAWGWTDGAPGAGREHAYSPHAWGWTAVARRGVHTLCVFPTRVGMDRGVSHSARANPRIPHTRGDGPDSLVLGHVACPYSPHAWGWTAEHNQPCQQRHVFPTRVGMDRDNLPGGCRCRRIPHTRGDGPDPKRLFRQSPPYSPHAWGWTVRRPAEIVGGAVFPTRVGMDRPVSAWSGPRRCIPHTRGDGPWLGEHGYTNEKYSPHAWGWTAHAIAFLAQDLVFPTRVGMDRTTSLDTIA